MALIRPIPNKGAADVYYQPSRAFEKITKGTQYTMNAGSTNLPQKYILTNGATGTISITGNNNINKYDIDGTETTITLSSSTPTDISIDENVIALGVTLSSGQSATYTFTLT